MAEDVKPSISEQCRSCIASLTGTIAALSDSKETTRLSQRDVNEELERFSLWTGNIGALHRPESQLSVESRLVEAQEVLLHIQDLLENLQEVATELLQIASGEREGETDFISPDESTDCDAAPQEVSEEVELLEEVGACINRLFRVSSLIRQAAPTDLFAKALSKSRLQFNDQFDISHVVEKFPKLASVESQWLVTRLGRAITSRRRYLAYIQNHRYMLGTTDVDPASSPAAKGSTAQNQQPKASMPMLDTASRPSTYITKASTLAPGRITPQMLLPEVESEAEEDTQSYTTISRSVDGNHHVSTLARIPKLTDLGVGRKKEVECPFCFRLKRFKNEKAWRIHVFSDLRSYNCTFPECDSQLFGDMNDWFRHEMQNHRINYSCRLCRGKEYSGEAQYLKHIRHHHPELLVDGEEQSLLDISRKPLEQIPASACPFCEDWSLRLADREFGSRMPHVETSEIAVVPHIFKRHVAAHLEELALFAVPIGLVSEGSVADSNAAIEQTESNLSHKSNLSALTFQSNRSSSSIELQTGHAHDELERQTQKLDSTERFEQSDDESLRQLVGNLTFRPQRRRQRQNASLTTQFTVDGLTALFSDDSSSEKPKSGHTSSPPPEPFKEPQKSPEARRLFERNSDEPPSSFHPSLENAILAAEARRRGLVLSQTMHILGVKNTMLENGTITLTHEDQDEYNTEESLEMLLQGFISANAPDFDKTEPRLKTIWSRPRPGDNMWSIESLEIDDPTVSFYQKAMEWENASSNDTNADVALNQPQPEAGSSSTEQKTNTNLPRITLNDDTTADVALNQHEPEAGPSSAEREINTNIPKVTLENRQVVQFTDWPVYKDEQLAKEARYRGQLIADRLSQKGILYTRYYDGSITIAREDCIFFVEADAESIVAEIDFHRRELLAATTLCLRAYRLGQITSKGLVIASFDRGHNWEIINCPKGVISRGLIGVKPRCGLFGINKTVRNAIKMWEGKDILSVFHLAYLDPNLLPEVLRRSMIICEELRYHGISHTAGKRGLIEIHESEVRPGTDVASSARVKLSALIYEILEKHAKDFATAQPLLRTKYNISGHRRLICTVEATSSLHTVEEAPEHEVESSDSDYSLDDWEEDGEDETAHSAYRRRRSVQKGRAKKKVRDARLKRQSTIPASDPTSRDNQEQHATGAEDLAQFDASDGSKMCPNCGELYQPSDVWSITDRCPDCDLKPRYS